VRPESPTTVPARLEQEKNPPRGVGVVTSGAVGYESGTYIDPVTGHLSGFRVFRHQSVWVFQMATRSLPTSLTMTAR
jgi:hypothetical protein